MSKRSRSGYKDAFRKLSDDELQECYGQAQDLSDVAYEVFGLDLAADIDDIFEERLEEPTDE